MSERPETVGDLASDRKIISVRKSDIVHLTDADCHVKLSIESGRVMTAAAMWDDTPVCQYCSDRFDPNQGGGRPVFDPNMNEFRADGGVGE